MSVVSTVLVGDWDGPAGEAATTLGTMVARGMVRPFWFVDARMARGRPWPGVSFGRQGPEDVPLFTSIGEQAASEIRIAVLATSGDGVATDQVAQVAAEVHRQLLSLAPGRSSVRVARIWFPEWEALAEPGGAFFSTHADANLVVIPEDRRSDSHFAAPLTPEADSFAGHVAAETASIMGMFAGMEGCALDGMGPGVIFGDQPKVRLARSFVRVGRSPALPLQEIVDHEGRLPVPPGTIEAPSPSAAVADIASRSGPIFESLVFEVRDPEPPQRRQLRPTQALLLVLKEMGLFVISLPKRAVEGLFEDFSELAGRTMQDLVGSSSIVEVVWRGKFDPGTGGVDFDALIADLKAQAERRLDLQGGASIDQTVWHDLRTLVLSTVDGSQPPAAVDPIELQGRRAVVNDAAALALHPQDGLVGTAKAILDEAESETPITLLGRLGARIEAIAGANRTAVSQLLETLDVRLTALANYRPPGFAFWHIAGSVLLAAFVVSLLLLTGLVRDWGITDISPMMRDVAFAVLTAACAGALFLFRGYGAAALAEGATGRRADRRASLGTGPIWLGGLFGAGVAWLFVSIGVANLGYPDTDIAASSALLAGVVTGAGLGQAYSLAAHQDRLPAAGRMSRLSILVVLVYVSVLVVGAIAQPDGWYATATDVDLARWRGPVCWGLGLALLAVLAFVSWRRVQERLALRWYGQSIRGLAEQVDAAFTADRVADAAREQFLGLSAVLSRLIWYPYGKGGSLPESGAGLPGFGVSKAAVCQFGLSSRGEKLFEVRTLRLASERGWLTAQYEGSVQSYRAEQALLVGTDDPSAVNRPDQDPKTVAQYDAESRADRGDRWRWADLFFDGSYDPDFLQALETHGEKEVFGPILADPANFEPIGDCAGGLSLIEFMSEVFPEGDGSADPRFFDPDHLAGGAFERTWHQQVWWPREQLFAAGSRVEDKEIHPVGSLARGAVWVAVRADTTEDVEPAAIFGGAGADVLPEAVSPGPEF